MNKFFNRVQVVAFVLIITIPSFLYLVFLMIKRVFIGALDGLIDFYDYDASTWLRIPYAIKVALKNGTGLNWSALRD